MSSQYVVQGEVPPSYAQSFQSAGYQTGAPPSYNQDIEAGQIPPQQHDEGWKGPVNFSEKTIRHAFIRKVYCILGLQLFVTFGMVALFTFSKSVSNWARDNPGVLISAAVLSIVFMLVLICAGNIRRKTPHNFILLMLFTLCEGYLLGAIAGRYDRNEVIMAVGITLGIVVALTLFSFQTRFDFTGMGPYLFVVLICLVLFGFMNIFLHSQVLHVLYSAIAAVLFSLYLVYDTQIMIGGSHRYSLSPEEYIFAALNLYLDIVQIFMAILSLAGNK